MTPLSNDSPQWALAPRAGTTGTALFVFNEPSVFDNNGSQVRDRSPDTRQIMEWPRRSIRSIRAHVDGRPRDQRRRGCCERSGSNLNVLHPGSPPLTSHPSPQMGGDITGLFLTDEEGTMSTVDVSAKFINGKPAAIEAKYIMRSSTEWDRFMRFMQRYAEDNGLGFNQK